MVDGAVYHNSIPGQPQNRRKHNGSGNETFPPPARGGKNKAGGLRATPRSLSRRRSLSRTVATSCRMGAPLKENGEVILAAEAPPTDWTNATQALPRDSAFSRGTAGLLTSYC